MVYKFLIGSEESENFKLEILIDSGDTFLRLRNEILDAVGFDKGQMNSFYICDEDWNKEEEVTYVDMGTDSDQDIWLMESTKIDELVEEEEQRLKFVFDYMTERYMYMKLKEIKFGESLMDPLCQRKVGRPPKESVELETIFPKTQSTTTTQAIDDLGEEFYGDEQFNAEELEEFGEMPNDEI